MTATETTEIEIPEGFEPHFRASPLTKPWEPIYHKRTPDAVILGLRLAEPHTNSRGIAHGGFITAMADNAMGLSCGMKRDGGITRLITASLGVDFIASARIGNGLPSNPRSSSSATVFASSSASSPPTANGSPVPTALSASSRNGREPA